MISKLIWNEEEYRLTLFWRLLLFYIIRLLVGRFIIPTMGIALYPSISQSSIGFILFSVLEIVIFLGIVWFASHTIDRRDIRNLGLNINKDWWIEFGMGLILGLVFVGITFGIKNALGWVAISERMVTISPFDEPFLVLFIGQLIMIIGIAFSSEVVLRGYVFKNLAEGLHPFEEWAPIMACILVSVVVGVGALPREGMTWFGVLNAIMMALMFGAGMLMTGRLALSIGLHLMWSILQTAVFGLQSTALILSASVLRLSEAGGPPLLAGDTSGLQQGLLGIAAMLITITLMGGFVYLRYGSVGIQDELTEPELRPR